MTQAFLQPQLFGELVFQQQRPADIFWNGVLASILISALPSRKGKTVKLNVVNDSK